MKGMINNENSSFYLRYLSNMTDLKPISFKQIPKELHDYYSIPALSQSLNISIKYPNINWSKVENYFTNNTFNSYDDLVNFFCKKNCFHLKKKP